MSIGDKNYQIYLFECDWYAEWLDKEEHSQGLLMASSYAEAVQALVKRCPGTYNIFITEYGDCQFVFLNKTLFSRMLNDDEEIGLDYPEETETIEICGQEEDEW